VASRAKIVFLLGVLSLATFAREVGEHLGIFSHCHVIFDAILEIRGQSYLQDARDLGVKDPSQVVEYIERRIRNRYFSEEVVHRAQQMVLTTRVLKTVPDFIGGPGPTVDELRDLFRLVIVRTQGGEFAPLTFDLLNYHFPNRQSQLDQVRDLMKLSMGMAEYRRLISRAFTQLPITTLDRTVNELPDLSVLYLQHFEDLSKAINETRETVLMRVLQKYWRERFLANLGHKPNGPVSSQMESDRRLRQLALSLMQAKNVPSSVKDEISRELNFMDKYHFSSQPIFHPFFVEFLERSADYFDIERPK